MEHIHGSWGRVGTQYFVRNYRDFSSTFEGKFVGFILVMQCFYVLKLVVFDYLTVVKQT